MYISQYNVREMILKINLDDIKIYIVKISPTVSVLGGSFLNGKSEQPRVFPNSAPQRSLFIYIFYFGLVLFSFKNLVNYWFSLFVSKIAIQNYYKNCT